MFGLKSHQIIGIKKEIEKALKEEARKKEEEGLNKKHSAKKEEVTLKKKLLILDYLGIIKSIDMDNTKKAKLLSILLNQSEQNIREYLSDMYSREKEVKTKENLNYVSELFSELNLSNHKKQVIRDIEKFIEKD